MIVDAVNLDFVGIVIVARPDSLPYSIGSRSAFNAFACCVSDGSHEAYVVLEEGQVYSCCAHGVYIFGVVTYEAVDEVVLVDDVVLVVFLECSCGDDELFLCAVLEAADEDA